MARSNQELWIGLLGLIDYLTDKGESWAFGYHAWKEEVMERGELAEEDFRAFLRQISARKAVVDGHGAPPAPPSGSGHPPPEDAPAIEQTKANPLRETLKRGQMATGKTPDEKTEVLEQELDQVMRHLEP